VVEIITTVLHMVKMQQSFQTSPCHNGLQGHVLRDACMAQIARNSLRPNRARGSSTPWQLPPNYVL